MGFFESLKNGLTKTKNQFIGQVDSIFRAFGKIDEDMLEELEEILICADVGYETTEEIITQMREKMKEERISDPEAAKAALKQILRNMLGDARPLSLQKTPLVILVIGVNGVGKTTSIAKMANLFRQDGKKVLLAAADTFRAAAIDQLDIWANRIGVDLIKQAEGSDPAAVVFDAVNAAKSRKSDVLIVDTAGRLHNKKNLMDELAKINRVIERELPDTAKETFLVLDATTGQNAINQAVEFKNAAQITGLILTKLDGTAKGGIIFSIKKMLDIPVRFVGVGEKQEDLQPFDPDSFIDALFA
ncbi:MAG: signal recognition particle-docking protein FtsY [Clostridiales bacterium]|nr:signal recognition particle-docking protein FtsY [Clostridiales bacterium]